MVNEHSTPMQCPLPLGLEIVEVKLRPGVTAIVDDTDADLATLKWYANKNGQTIYAMRGKKRKSCYLHRVIMSRTLGRELRRGECVDHIDGDGLNNRRSNLRLATHRQNLRNQRRNSANTSGYKGVHWNKTMKKWHARIEVNGKRITLGYFDDPKDGHRAYCDAAQEIFGEFARPD